MKVYKRLRILLLSLMAVTLLYVNVLAEERIDLNQDVSLTVSCQDHDKPLAGIRFQIYAVAGTDEDGELTVTEQFRQYNADIQEKNDEAWRSLASTLEGYVLRDKLVPADSGSSDSNGQVSFPTEGKILTPGLYLVLADRYIQDDCCYDAAPFMVMLPSRDMKSGKWIYSVTANAKLEPSENPGDTDTVKRKVLKVWRDEGHEQERPKEIVVQLLQDDKIYDTVRLNAENNWRHTWTKLPADSRWTVVEKETDHYTVKVDQEEITFVVTNTYAGDNPGGNPGEPSKGGSTGSGQSKLPQTGQLWWPVPLLLAAGLLFLIAGVIRRRGNDDE